MEELILRLLMKKYGDDSKKLEILKNYKNDEQLKKLVTNIQLNVSKIGEILISLGELGGEKMSLTRTLNKRRVYDSLLDESYENNPILESQARQLRCGLEGTKNSIITFKRINRRYGPNKIGRTFRKDI